MYIDSIISTIEGLHHPSCKSLVSAKKIWFPVVAHSAEYRILLQTLPIHRFFSWGGGLRVG
jgi:hypothetical protein